MTWRAETDQEAEGFVVHRLLLTVEQAAETLGVGRTTVFGLLSQGLLASVRIGGSRRIPVDALRAFVSDLCDNRDGPLGKVNPEVQPRTCNTTARRRKRARRSTGSAQVQPVSQLSLRLDHQGTGIEADQSERQP